MNILEAFKKSDKATRGNGIKKLEYRKKDYASFCMRYEDLLATDWEPVIEPLTFERIKRECVSGESLLNISQPLNMYVLHIGFNRVGELVTDTSSGRKSQTWNEHEIRNWQISSETWEG